MSTADGKHTGLPEVGSTFTSHPIYKDSVGNVTLAGDLVLTAQFREFLRIDPDGSARNVDLPAEATSNGLRFTILNTAGGAENLVVRNDGGGTIVTISQNERATVVCDGVTWYHMGITSIALS